MHKKAVTVCLALLFTLIQFTSCLNTADSSEATILATETDSIEPVITIEETIATTEETVPTDTPTPTPSPTPTPIPIEELYSIIDSIPSSDVLQVQTFGGYTPSSSALEQLDAAMAEFNSYYYDYSFTMIDINTGRGITYNPDQIFYPASSIKGPFALSLAELNPEAAVTYDNTITNMLVNSDNDAYTLLNGIFGRQYIQQWFDDCNIVSSYANYKFPRLCSRDYAKLWLHGYDFLMNNELGPTAMEWLNHPVQSAINSALGELYETFSKAGWMTGEDPAYNAAVDAGIVMSDLGPYVIVVHSNVPANLDRLTNIILALETVHQDIYN